MTRCIVTFTYGGITYTLPGRLVTTHGVRPDRPHYVLLECVEFNGRLYSRTGESWPWWASDEECEVLDGSVMA